MTTLFTMTVDTEEEWYWDTGWPRQNLTVENIRHLPRFQELCSRHGVATTYYTNYAVFDNSEARTILMQIAHLTHVEIGMHIHPWNTPPFDLHCPVKTQDTFIHNLPVEVAIQKLENVYSRFVENGLKPTSFRGGRYSSGPAVQQFLRDKGFWVDSSVVPYASWKDTGAPDYRHRDVYPVRLPPRREGDQPLWEIPLTMGFSRRPFQFWRRAFACVGRSWLRKLRLVGIAERLGLVRQVWLNFEQPLGWNMLPFLRKLRRMQVPCICFTLHSSSLMAGKNRYTPTQADEDRLFAYLDEIFGTIAEWPDFQSATATEVALRLEELHRARSWN